MNQTLKVTLVTAAVLVVTAVVVLIIVLSNQRQVAAPIEEAGGASVVRPESHVLDQGLDGAVTVVEFLDFECEICGAFYPVVEDIRERYAGEITYVVRYFPLPGHANSMTAALAAEAAAEQGNFEGMYHRLFETQAEWGERQDSQAARFREFAVELGLDMERYDAAVADPQTQARVQRDFDEGRVLGVGGTPTFYVDGVQIDLKRLTDITDAIDRALAKVGS